LTAVPSGRRDRSTLREQYGVNAERLVIVP
jgi:hypothetical protein